MTSFKACSCLRRPQNLFRSLRSNRRGQAVVEFTLIFVLLLALAWIPAEFGLAFFTGQLAQNAAREGARIAAADRSLAAGTFTCTMPCSAAPADSVLAATAQRLSRALLTTASVTLTYPVAGGPACNQQVRVQVQGTYNFYFYSLLRLLGASVPSSANIVRQADMRWEHQASCLT
jgi:Flp pilus assembly protein TadG